jgi:hypothetical protein
MTLMFKSSHLARVVRVASVSLYRNFSKKILYGGKAYNPYNPYNHYNPYNPYRLLPVGNPLSFTSSRQSIRGSSGTELRNWAAVLTVTSIQLCVKRLLARPAWGLELLAYFVLLPRQLVIYRPFYEQLSDHCGYQNNPRHVFAN